MFSVEIKVNSQLTAHIYGRNIGTKTQGDDYEYEFRYYEPETGILTSDIITHKHEYGINALVLKILQAAEALK